MNFKYSVRGKDGVRVEFLISLYGKYTGRFWMQNSVLIDERNTQYVGNFSILDLGIDSSTSM